MQIFVTLLDGSTLTVQTAEETVDDVKRQIEALEGVPVELQRIVFEGKELAAGRSLAPYNVQDGATLHLTMNLDGGYRYYIPPYERFLATKHLLYKNICRKCYGRLSPYATRCRKAKCGRTSDIRPKKLWHHNTIYNRRQIFENFNIYL